MAERLTIDELIKVIEWLKEARFDKGLWETLGLQLGLYQRTLGVIKINKGDVNSCFTECLSEWLKRADGVDGVGQPSLTSLADALKKMNGCKDQAEYITSLLKGDSSEEKKSAKSTGPKIDSTKKSGAENKDGGAQASAGIEDTDGPAQGGSIPSKAKQQNALSSKCNGWIILPLCIAAVVVVFAICLPLYLPVKEKEGKPNNDVYPEDVKPPQAPLSTTVIPTATVQSNGGSTTMHAKPVSNSDHGKRSLGIEDADMVLTVLKKAFFGPTKWEDLGLKLGLLMPTLKVIAETGDAHKHLKKTIEAWLEGEDNVTSRTWQTLIDAVRETGDRAAADRIPEKLKTLYNITL